MPLLSHHKFSDSEIQDVIEHLETADKNHRKWLTSLHTSMICGTPFEKDVFAKDAHRCCLFGQWYYHHAPQLLQNISEFKQLESMHQEMHDYARLLANACQQRQTIEVNEYKNFIDNQQVFSSTLLSLRDQLCEYHYSFDALTGLMTRQPFSRVLEVEYSRMQRTGKPCCLVIIDIDNFKKINDCYGHLVGDHVLINIAEYIRINLRPYDSVCRYGGEEFLITLPETPLDKAFEIIDRLRKNIQSQIFRYREIKKLRLTVSAGVSLLSSEDFDYCLENADKALYRAKNSGRNQVCLSD